MDGVVLFLFLWVDYLTETNKTGVWVLWEVGFGVCWAWVGFCELDYCFGFGLGLSKKKSIWFAVIIAQGPNLHKLIFQGP